MSTSKPVRFDHASPRDGPASSAKKKGIARYEDPQVDDAFGLNTIDGNQDLSLDAPSSQLNETNTFNAELTVVDLKPAGDSLVKQSATLKDELRELHEAGNFDFITIKENGQSNKKKAVTASDFFSGPRNQTN